VALQSDFRANCMDGDSVNQIWTGPLPLQFADGSNLAPVDPF
jgi:hypothetical protein